MYLARYSTVKTKMAVTSNWSHLWMACGCFNLSAHKPCKHIVNITTWSGKLHHGQIETDALCENWSTLRSFILLVTGVRERHQCCCPVLPSLFFTLLITAQHNKTTHPELVQVALPLGSQLSTHHQIPKSLGCFPWHNSPLPKYLSEFSFQKGDCFAFILCILCFVLWYRCISKENLLCFRNPVFIYDLKGKHLLLLLPYHLSSAFLVAVF